MPKSTNHKAVCVIAPPVYAKWRSSALGRITDQLEDQLIRRDLPDLKGRRVLDVGCGDGFFLSWLAEQGADVTGVDASPEMLQAARERFAGTGLDIPVVLASAANLPFPDRSFDVVTAVTILCFVSDPRPIFTELHRVLRPGGKLIIGELGRWSLWAAWRRIRAWAGSPVWRAAHFRTPREFRRLARYAGFDLECIRGGIFYPPVGSIARVMRGIDPWLGRCTSFGAAFLVLTAHRPDERAGERPRSDDPP